MNANATAVNKSAFQFANASCGAQYVASHSIAALIINENNPRVRNANGAKMNSTNGLSTIFKSVRIPAALIMSKSVPENETPGMYATASCRTTIFATNCSKIFARKEGMCSVCSVSIA